jgi:hypothetical protein
MSIAVLAAFAAAFVALLKIFGVDIDDAWWWYAFFIALYFAATAWAGGLPWVRRQ